VTSFLITGGTGSFGNAFIRHLLAHDAASRIVVYSRDELKQHEMRLNGFTDPRLRWFIGDVRDRDRLALAMRGVDVVVHAAALKQVDTCENNPLEAKKTNIDGAENVISAALEAEVSKVLALGTDKAVDPTNMYGFTKGAAEKLIVDANVYSGGKGTIFAGTRYGNVISSRGSVVPVFERQHAASRPLTLTAPEMTRFVMTLPQCVAFVLQSISVMDGGEVFVPRLPAVTLETLAHAVTWPAKPELEYTGLRPGEKMHEAMVSPHESARTRDRGWCFAVAPISYPREVDRPGGRLPVGFSFTSDTTTLLTASEFRDLAGLTERKAA
jgi:UDP-N-acetylglucosamine 4,6-dehydratase